MLPPGRESPTAGRRRRPEVVRKLPGPATVGRAAQPHPTPRRSVWLATRQWHRRCRRRCRRPAMTTVAAMTNVTTEAVVAAVAVVAPQPFPSPAASDRPHIPSEARPVWLADAAWGAARATYTANGAWAPPNSARQSPSRFSGRNRHPVTADSDGPCLSRWGTPSRHLPRRGRRLQVTLPLVHPSPTPPSGPSQKWP